MSYPFELQSIVCFDANNDTHIDMLLIGGMGGNVLLLNVGG